MAATYDSRQEKLVRGISHKPLNECPIPQVKEIGLKALCKVICEHVDENGTTYEVVGSGFVSSIRSPWFDSYYGIFTADHVVKNAVKVDVHFEGVDLKLEDILNKDAHYVGFPHLDACFLELSHGHTVTGSPNLIEYDRKFIINSPRKPAIESDVYVVQHPDGGPAKYAKGRIVSGGHDSFVSHSASTERGSSGSPVLCRLPGSDKFEAIGIHTQAGIGEYNEAVSMQDLLYNLIHVYECTEEGLRRLM